MNESYVSRMPDQDKSQIVANGGWIEEKRVYQKKALLFKTLAILWIVPSLTSLFVIAYGFRKEASIIETVRLIPIEQWLSLLLILLEPTFIYLAVRYRRTEIPTERIVSIPNPDYDPKNLY